MTKLEIKTKAFSQLIGITEEELVWALKHTGEIKGIKLPEPALNPTNKTRGFYYDDVIKFSAKLTEVKS